MNFIIYSQAKQNCGKRIDKIKRKRVRRWLEYMLKKERIKGMGLFVQ